MDGVRLFPTPLTICPPPIISFEPATDCFARKFPGRGQIRYIGASSSDDGSVFCSFSKLLCSPGGLAATGAFFRFGTERFGVKGTRLAAGQPRLACQAGSFRFDPGRGA